MTSLQHPYSHILSDCISIVFTYYTLIIHENISEYDPDDKKFIKRFISCFSFDTDVKVQEFLERTMHVEKKIFYVDASYNETIDAQTFPYFRGILKLNLESVPAVCDEALENLRGVEVLSISKCNKVTTKGFVNLRGVKTLFIDDMDQLDDFALEQIRGVNCLSIGNCYQFTDAGMANLRGVERLSIQGCTQLSDSAFVNFRGIRILNMHDCHQSSITNAAFDNIRGIKKLNMGRCTQIEDVALKNLIGVESLNLFGCFYISNEGLQYVRGVNSFKCVRSMSLSEKGFRALREATRVRISDMDLTEEAAQNLRLVQDLRLSHVTLTNGRFENFQNVCRLDLTHVNLSSVNDDSFRNMHNLRKLALLFCDDSSLTHRVFEHLTGLESFSCQWTDVQLGEDDVEQVVEWLRGLQGLSMSGRNGNLDKVVEMWQEQHPGWVDYDW